MTYIGVMNAFHVKRILRLVFSCMKSPLHLIIIQTDLR
jgi:hypothetical protein